MRHSMVVLLGIIYVDDREGSKEMADLIEGAITVHLEFGDAMFPGNGPEGPVEIGVERKRIGDLVNSITTGRLSGHQLPGLLEAYYRTYLIVEGVWAGDLVDDELKVRVYGNEWRPLNRGKRKFRASDVWTYLTTLEMTGVIVRTTRDLAHTCQVIQYLAKWWEKKWEKHKGHDMPHRLIPPAAALYVNKPSRTRMVAKEMPHVGWERSKAVEERFGTLEEMAIATEEEWREVEGLGVVSAREIYKFIHRGG